MIFQAHRGIHPISLLIRVFSPGYNHISIRLDDYVYEAHVLHGVVRTHVDDWDDKTVVELCGVEGDEVEVKAFLERQVGKKYDFMGIFNFIWKRIPQKEGQWFCSEMAMVAYAKALNIPNGTYNKKLTPRRFWKHVTY